MPIQNKTHVSIETAVGLVSAAKIQLEEAQRSYDRIVNDAIRYGFTLEEIERAQQGQGINREDFCKTT